MSTFDEMGDEIDENLRIANRNITIANYITAYLFGLLTALIMMLLS